MGLTHKQKHALARVILDAVGDKIEFWSEYIPTSPDYEVLKDIPGTLIAEQFTRWLQHLPGDTWDTRLPSPRELSNKEG